MKLLKLNSRGLLHKAQARLQYHGSCAIRVDVRLLFFSKKIILKPDGKLRKHRVRVHESLTRVAENRPQR